LRHYVVIKYSIADGLNVGLKALWNQEKLSVIYTIRIHAIQGIILA
jgi:hypothetical protein